MHSVPHRVRECASALSLASTSSSTHTSGPLLRSCTTRCPSGLALASLSPTFIISSISPHGTLGQTARACSSPLLRSPVTLKGVHLGLSRASRLARGSLHTSKHTDAQTGTMLPSPRLSQGPTACKAASAWRQWRRGRQRGMPPRRRRTSRIEHRPLRRRGGDMGVLLLRPTRSKLWFTCNSGLGARKGWSFASDLQRLRLVSSRRWALRSHLL